MCSPQSNTSWTVDMVPKIKTPPSLVQHPKAAAMVDNGGEVDGLWTVLATTAVPLLVFFSAYIWMYRASQRDITRGRYTQWAYMEILLLLPLLPFFPVARRIAVVNAFGLGFGIHCFYAITQYRSVATVTSQSMVQLERLWHPLLLRHHTVQAPSLSW